MRKKQQRSAIWYGYYDKAAKEEVPSARSTPATPQEISRPSYPELRNLYKGSEEGILIGSETEAERSGAEEHTLVTEAAEGSFEVEEQQYQAEDKKVSLIQPSRAGDLRPRPRPTQRSPAASIFSPSLSRDQFRERFRSNQLSIQRREETEAKQKEEEKARVERTRLRGAYSQGSKQVLGVDWHKTLAGESGRVSAANRALLAEYIEAGYRIVIISFASSRKRQEQVLAGRRALQHVLGHPLRLVLCPRKLSSDGGARESLTGDLVCKAEAILEEKVTVYVDDQAVILQDVQRSQRHKPRRSQTLCLQASKDPDFSLAPLRDLIRETAPEDLPVIH